MRRTHTAGVLVDLNIYKSACIMQSTAWAEQRREYHAKYVQQRRVHFACDRPISRRQFGYGSAQAALARHRQSKTLPATVMLFNVRYPVATLFLQQETFVQLWTVSRAAPCCGSALPPDENTQVSAARQAPDRLNVACRSLATVCASRSFAQTSMDRVQRGATGYSRARQHLRPVAASIHLR